MQEKQKVKNLEMVSSILASPTKFNYVIIKIHINIV